MCSVRLDRSPAFLATLALAALAPTAFGQMVWKKMAVTASAGPRDKHAMAYDSLRQRTVVFGGAIPAGNYGIPLADTWELDGYAKKWVKRSPATSPKARIEHAMAYDSVRRVIVMFGGFEGRFGTKLLNDTWEYDGKNWRQRRPTTSPPPLAGHTIVYDSNRRVMVLFGGWTKGRPTPAVSGQIWEWDGTNWRRVFVTSSPSPRANPAMVYDVARRVVVLFGGVDGALWYLSDTWEWGGGSIGWLQRTTSRSPPSVWGRLVHDEARNRCVWYGNGISSSVWEWDGNTWRKNAAQVSPTRAWYAMVYDSNRRRVVLFSGSLWAVAQKDTWEYYPTYRGSAMPVGAGCAGSAGIPVITASGPPILGNRDFRIRIDSAKPNSTAFVGLALKPATLSIGGCTLFLDLAFAPILVGGRSNGAGALQLPLPIPFNPALRGFRLEAQGFINDPQGTYFRLLAFTNGLRLVFGD